MLAQLRKLFSLHAFNYNLSAPKKDNIHFKKNQYQLIDIDAFHLHVTLNIAKLLHNYLGLSNLPPDLVLLSIYLTKSKDSELKQNIKYYWL